VLNHRFINFLATLGWHTLFGPWNCSTSSYEGINLLKGYGHKEFRLHIQYIRIGKAPIGRISNVFVVRINLLGVELFFEIYLIPPRWRRPTNMPNIRGLCFPIPYKSKRHTFQDYSSEIWVGNIPKACKNLRVRNGSEVLYFVCYDILNSFYGRHLS